MSAIAFIDRDGTINVEKNYVYRREDFELIPGSLPALQKLTHAGVIIYVITNQAGIAKGIYREEDFFVLNDYFLKLMKDSGVLIQETLYCPHHPEAIVEKYRKICDCRKPGNYLIQKTLKKESAKASEAFMVGDRNSDILAGQSLKIPSYLVLTGYGTQEKDKSTADFIVGDLQEAVDHFLGNL